LKKYLSEYTNLVKEWNSSKNNDLKPENFTYGSKNKVWWVCKKGHEWKASISSRTSGRGCPYCSGKKPSKDNNLKVKFPKIAKEFHPTKNGDLKPSDFTSGSNKTVWWICKKGHEWKAIIKNRTSGRGCPYCSGKKPSKDNNLKVKFPKIAKEFHPTKNGDLKPSDFTSGSNKTVWWVCLKGHGWDASIKSRTNGSGCPYCSGKRINPE
jgi:DNA-directed RNA polymerase subunit RPC12/RpoP